MPQALVLPVISVGGTTLLTLGGAAALAGSAYYQNRQTKKRQAQLKQLALSSQLSGVTQMIRSSTEPKKIFYGKNNRASGTLCFAHVENSSAGSWLYMVLGIAGHSFGTAVDTTSGLWINDTRLPEAYFEDFESWNRYNEASSSDAANYNLRVLQRCHWDGGTTVDATLLDEIPDYWKDEEGRRHRFTDTSYVIVKLGYNSSVFPNGIPNISVELPERTNITDFRTASNATSATCSNPVLVLYDYLTNSDYGLGFSTSEIDETSFTSAANHCDVDVDGEPRFTLNGFISTEDEPQTNIEKVLDCFGGILTYSGGQWRVKSSQWTTPVMTLDESNLRSGIKVQSKQSKKDIFNTAKIIFSDGDNSSLQPVSVNVVNSSYKTIDQEEELLSTFEIPLIRSSTQAQRLANVLIERNRHELIVEVEADLSALDLIPGDNVYLDSDKFAWDQKPFEVIEFSLNSSDGSLTIGLVLRETDSTIFDDSETSAAETFPVSNLPSPWKIGAPTDLSISENLEVLGDVVQTRISLSWTAPTVGFVSHYSLEYKASASEDWISLGRVDNTSFSFYQIAGTYDFRVRAFNQLGAASDYLTTEDEVIAGKTANPEDVSNFAYTVDGFRLNFSWDQVSDLDLSYYELRYNLGSADWDTGTLLDKSKINNFSLQWGTIGTTYFLIKAVDTTGNYSDSAASLTITISRPSGVQNLSGESYGNQVILKFDAPSSGTFNIGTYIFYRSTSAINLSGAVEIARNNSEYLIYTETELAGTYVYWVLPVDVYGNSASTDDAESVSVVVGRGIGYDLHTTHEEDLTGFGLTEASLDYENLVCMDADLTWDGYISGSFTESVTTWQDVLDYGVTKWMEPVHSLYEDYFRLFYIDLGAVYSHGVTVSINLTENEITPGIVKAFFLQASETGSEYTTFSTGSSGFTSQPVRYLGLSVIWNRTEANKRLGLLEVTGLDVTIELPKKSDSGSASVVSTDSGGTEIDFNVAFGDITSITATPKGTSELKAVVNFTDGSPNPDSFRVLCYDSAGSRVSCDIYWSAEGY